MTPLAQNVTDILSFLTVLSGLLAIFLLVLLATPLKKRGWGKTAYDFFAENAILFAFAIALASVVSSLFYDWIVGFAPCLLCWWQRVFIYPQAVLLAIALAKNDEHVRKYCLSLSGIGILFSIYHSYLQFGGESIFPCSATGVSCEHVYFLEFGYVTIPTMALTAFAHIILFMLFRKRS